MRLDGLTYTLHLKSQFADRRLPWSAQDDDDEEEVPAKASKPAKQKRPAGAAPADAKEPECKQQ